MRFVKNHTFQTAVLLAIILIMTVPYAASCFYAFPSCDDYAFALMRQDYIAEHGSNPFNVVAQTISAAMSKGYNFCLLTTSVLNPLLYGNITTLRVYLCCFFVLFLVSLWAISLRICRYFLTGCDSRHVLFLTAILCFCFLNLANYGDVFYYFVVSASYLTTVSVTLLSGAFLLDYVFAKRTGKLVLSALTAAFVGCAPANIGALCCFVLLFIACWALFCRRSSAVVCIPLLLTVLFTLLYLLMPGISYRAAIYHTDGAGLANYLKALSASLSIAFNRVWHFLSATVLPLLLVAFGTFIYRHESSKSGSKFFRYPLLALITVILIPTVVAYPVVLGYQGYYPNRCVFVTDAAIFWVLLAATAYIAVCFKRQRALGQYKAVIGKCAALVCCALCVFSLCFVASPTPYPVVMLSKELYSGKLAANRKVWDDSLDALKEQKGQNVAYYIDPDVVSNFILYPSQFLQQDPWDLLNRNFARYYGLAFVSSDFEYDFAARLEKEKHD